MSYAFTKLFASITESTVWCEPMPTRIVWITMLAKADRNGRVFASVPGLANLARVTVEEAEVAVARFQEPDRYSRTPDHDGRRIEPIDGGWRLLNYEKYRAIRDEEARREYQRDWDRTRRTRPTNPTESDKSDQIRPGPTQAEAEAEVPTADKSARKGVACPAEFESTWRIYPRRAGDNPKPRALRAWNARRQEGHSPSEIHAGVTRYAAYIRASGKEGTEFVKQAATFFGPDKGFMETWSASETSPDKLRLAI